MITFFRNFRNLKTAYILNIIGLSVAFAAFIIIMSQVRHEFMMDRHTPDSDRIYRLEILSQEDWGMGKAGSYVPIFTRLWGDEIIESSPLVEAGCIAFPFEDGVYCIIENPEPTGFREDFSMVSPDFLKVFHFDILEGTLESFLKPDYVLLPQSTAKKLFGNESAIGKQIKVQESLYDNSNSTYTVGGVYKDFKNSQIENSIYVPLENKIDRNGFFSRFNYQVYVKLIDSSDKTKQAFLDNYMENFHSKHEYGKEFTYRLNRFPDIYFTQDCLYDGYQEHGKLSTTLILLSIGILIIILATINFTNFSMALVPFRIKSINTKKVLGSTNSELRRGLIIDAVWTTIISALLSLAIVTVFDSTSFADISKCPLDIISNIDVVIGTLALSILIGIFAGIYPAKYTTSYSPALVLKGSFGLSPKGLRLRKILVAIQFIISMSLISCSLLIQKQNRYMQNGDLGFPTKNLLVSTLNSSFNGEKREIAERRIAALPYVKNVAFAIDLICSQDNFQRWNLGSKGEERAITAMLVSWNFPKTLELPLYEGEYPTEECVTSDNAYIIPNRLAKEAYDWDLSTTFELNQKLTGKIQAITENVKIFSLKVNPNPAGLLIINSNFRYIYIRTIEGIDLHKAITEIGQILNETDPNYPFSLVKFEDTIQERFKDDKAFEKGIMAFSLLAIIISIIGVFGLILFDTQQKRRDIAVRRIHGARESEILLMFTKPYMILLGICWIISIPIVIFTGRIWLNFFANKVSIGAGIFIISLAITLSITIITIISQVMRAVRNNPVDSIKIE